MGYGFLWQWQDKMPDISIMKLFSDDELEQYLDFNWETFEPDWSSYELMNYEDVWNLLHQAVTRLSIQAGFSDCPVVVLPVGEDDFGSYSRVCLVLRETFTEAAFNNVVPVPTMQTPATKEFLDMLIGKYFPSAVPGWMLWPYSTV